MEFLIAKKEGTYTQMQNLILGIQKTAVFLCFRSQPTSQNTTSYHNPWKLEKSGWVEGKTSSKVEGTLLGPREHQSQ